MHRLAALVITGLMLTLVCAGSAQAYCHIQNKSKHPAQFARLNAGIQTIYQPGEDRTFEQNCGSSYLGWLLDKNGKPMTGKAGGVLHGDDLITVYPTDNGYEWFFYSESKGYMGFYDGVYKLGD